MLKCSFLHWTAISSELPSANSENSSKHSKTKKLHEKKIEKIKVFQISKWSRTERYKVTKTSAEMLLSAPNSYWQGQHQAGSGRRLTHCAVVLHTWERERVSERHRSKLEKVMKWSGKENCYKDHTNCSLRPGQTCSVCT